ncbi:MAG: metallophosphoesterase [Gammaproteobacteria bacterium]|nr:metallophosphoesterase [Gammaproteobacteria bacterium]
MNAKTLKQHYESELEARSRPGGGDKRHGRRMFRAMLKASQALPPCELDAQGSVWVWSDLHLGHDNIIRYTNRPFADSRAMDSALYDNWATTVGCDDEIIFVGDLAMRAAVGPHTWQRIRDGRGAKKRLVIGNHDLTGSGSLRVDGFNEIGAVLFADGDPPLVFTHIPLTRVPDGCVNVHGHTHNEPTRASRHINVSVEQLDYRPVALPRLGALARCLLAGRYPDGATTLERLKAIGS